VFDDANSTRARRSDVKSSGGAFSRRPHSRGTMLVQRDCRIGWAATQVDGIALQGVTMQRRAFLAGLIGVAATVAFAGTSQAVPLARRQDLPAMRLDEIDDAMNGAGTGGMSPDGTPIEQAQYWYDRRRRRYRRRYRRYLRRRWRTVCRRRWWRGRWVRRCYRVRVW
jgi:hypothetical protein